MAFNVEEDVEVIGGDDHFKFALYSASIRDSRPDGLEVVYDNRETQEGNRLIQIVPMSQVRPIPNAIVAILREQDDVEAWLSGGWWRGVLVGKVGLSCIVYLDYMPKSKQYLVLAEEELRVPQEWSFIDNHEIWVYKKIIPDDALQVGAEVEVVEDEGIYRYAVRRGRIRSVEGENFEVEYHHLQNADGSPIIETVNASKVRYVPDAVVGILRRHDLVEAWMDGVWWQGIVKSVTPHSAILYFGYKEAEMKFVIIPIERLRVHQTWHKSGMYAIWIYRKQSD